MSWSKNTVCCLSLLMGLTALPFALADDGFDRHGITTKTFYNPRVNGVRLDSCYGFGYGCGQSAADAYCHSMGYGKAIGFSIAQGVSYTWMISTREICNHPDCHGFYWIRCIAGGDHEVLPLFERCQPSCCDIN